MTDLLNPREQAVIDLLVEVVNMFGKIVGDGETRDQDSAEVVFHVHALQRMVMAQAAARAYPDRFRLMGEVVSS